MDPISASLLVAVATGAAGEAGRQLWDSLCRLVRRNPARDAPGGLGPEVGELELASLSEAPHDLVRARVLGEALGRRAANDPAFRTELAQWHQQAQVVRTGDGDTANTVSGGTQNAPVLQGRDFSGITFNEPGRN
ncbi:hypothetical protein [Streptomyces fuscichromogenes]|uniref:Uncharacterized protein n=1 Tax=Streptomyces fuscichromogenes TaxID=1324013 RepID=A0A918CQI5_9ACTN|nr:hypothetical protein [Streptomyces fuscichromogenes]GGN04769.1 hypothetical protein GCM10011578_028160 [Streptomyces fuscichromogenes]